METTASLSDRSSITNRARYRAQLQATSRARHNFHLVTQYTVCAYSILRKLSYLLSWRGGRGNLETYPNSWFRKSSQALHTHYYTHYTHTVVTHTHYITVHTAFTHLHYALWHSMGTQDTWHTLCTVHTHTLIVWTSAVAHSCLLAKSSLTKEPYIHITSYNTAWLHLDLIPHQDSHGNWSWANIIIPTEPITSRKHLGPKLLLQPANILFLR